ncbi:hypothetical protein SanaruYs_17720 [Chryseotalea sanaruensis]|uniref:Uncharacterized protein n=1 Tax=Chryseotalea sanaruensis TaxID=2482724 RepID=A0A401U9J0_9BACT|nr:hypothetical protein [Chryseotalea sanaruensis]GCC51547.1 hypothetical protein SanaruYs_17720 [Chryseotalea sanaruensis]
MEKNKKTIESFDKRFTIEKHADKIVGGMTLSGNNRPVGANTICETGNPWNSYMTDDCADEFIIYLP